MDGYPLGKTLLCTTLQTSDVFTNPQDLWTLLFWDFMEVLSHRCDQVNHEPLGGQVNI
jgi:hypothetical protein